MSRFLILVLVLANIASAIGVVYARHRHRVLFDEVTRLERARDELSSAVCSSNRPRSPKPPASTRSRACAWA